MAAAVLCELRLWATDPLMRETACLEIFVEAAGRFRQVRAGLPRAVVIALCAVVWPSSSISSTWPISTA